MRTLSSRSAFVAAAFVLFFASGCNTRLDPVDEDFVDDGADVTESDTDDGWSDDDWTSPDPSDDRPSDPPNTEDPPADDPPADDPPAALDCGPNSFDNGLGSCECDANYDLCDAMDTGLGCCAYSTSTFEVTLVSVAVLPYKDPSSKKPWDWSGNVPSWVQDLIAEVALYVDQDAADWLEVLDYVYYFAPALLDGSTPPDLFVEVEIDDAVYYTSATVDDDIEAWWDESFQLTLGSSSELVLWYMDEDLVSDDTVEGALFTQADLQWYAGLGEIAFEGSFGAYEFSVVIEPVF